MLGCAAALLCRFVLQQVVHHRCRAEAYSPNACIKKSFYNLVCHHQCWAWQKSRQDKSDCRLGGSPKTALVQPYLRQTIREGFYLDHLSAVCSMAVYITCLPLAHAADNDALSLLRSLSAHHQAAAARTVPASFSLQALIHPRRLMRSRLLLTQT